MKTKGMFRRGVARFCKHANVKKELEAKISSLSDEVLRPVDQFGFLPKSTYATPMVILLGNHSSGKSTFINSLLGRQEQDTGVAPTDDGFTIIMRGDVDLDENGPTAISNPANGFTELKQHGSEFVNRFNLKIRKLPPEAKLPEGMMIVDTPGMIDTPATEDGTQHSLKSLEGQRRGYDFLAVTKWFAQRSDSILLMFDPSNPGTTGETLTVLTNSLIGQEHKFKIVLNKSDIFTKVTDYARTYGTLAWNLSKVIKVSKDIPPIFSTYTKLEEGEYKGAVPREEMERARKELHRVVLSAPLYRLDNLLTEMEEAAIRISISATICKKLISKFKRKRMITMAAIGGTVVGVPALFATVLFPVELGGMILAILFSAGTIGGTGYYLSSQLEEYQKQLLSSIDYIYEECYPSTGNGMTQEEKQRWANVRKIIMDRASAHGILALPNPSGSGVNRVKKILKNEVPELRGRIRQYKAEVSKEEL